MCQAPVRYTLVVASGTKAPRYPVRLPVTILRGLDHSPGETPHCSGRMKECQCWCDFVRDLPTF